MNNCKHHWVDNSCAICSIAWSIWADHRIKELTANVETMHNNWDITLKLLAATSKILGKRTGESADDAAKRVLETHRLQLAAISVQADCNTYKTVDGPLKDAHPDYITPALKDVNRAVHREIRQRNMVYRWQAIAKMMSRELVRRGMTATEISKKFGVEVRFVEGKKLNESQSQDETAAGHQAARIG